ncbi:peptidogalycan biosysnthesis protein [Cellulomonas sp. NPDC057328]|uniref:peptidogalycan biosysnthesis protein n=1 Tax=Cellulomonas sp. NPDC057328 TaxID=3346101 RepID=UPI003629B6CA
MTGSARVTVDTREELAGGAWSTDVASAPDAWPYLSAPWLRATTTALAGTASPLHAVAHRARGEEAWLPGYLFKQPPAVDWDPRTYLGWERPDGMQVCCGVESSGDATAEVARWGEDTLFPALVVGSPLGYRSEAAYSFWAPGLLGRLTTTLLEAARASGARSVVAPWVPQRSGNEEVLEAFRAAGGSDAYWGLDDYLPLEAASYAEHVAQQPRKRRQRLVGDQAALARAGLEIRRVAGADLEPYADRVAELVCMNREKNGAGEEPHHISTVLRALLAAGAELWGYLGLRDGEVVAACVAIRRGRRLFVKWAGFDYGVLGTRSGLYFPFCFDMPLRDAYGAGLRWMELGSGAHEAKTLRGCHSRTVSTALWLADEALRPRAAELLRDFGQRRRRAFDTDPAPAPAPVPLVLTPASSSSSSCCGGPS